MDRSITESVRDLMEYLNKSSRVPTKEERGYAMANRDDRFADLCCRIAEAYAFNRKAHPEDLRNINVLMRGE